MRRSGMSPLIQELRGRSVPDALVVGGGPAGLVFALRAAQKGLSVEVLERGQPPIDKPCGEGLMPDGVARLKEVGVPLGESASRSPQGRPFRGIRYLEDDLMAEGRFPDAPGVGVRRTVLHRTLARRAMEDGVEVHWGVKAMGLRIGSSRELGAVMTNRGSHSARWIVGADGLRSPVRRWAGLDKGPGRWRRFGVRRHFGVAPWTDLVEVHWADGCEAYVTPVASREVGVALLWGPNWRGEKPGFDRLLAEFPVLQRRLGDAPATSQDRGIGPLRQRVRAVHRGRVALLGDAAGYVDAITGEGLSLAIHEAFVLAEALEAGSLRGYERTVRRLRRLPDLFTRLLLRVERRPELRRRMIRTFAADAGLFSRLLAIHARQRPPSSLGFGGLFRLGWGLVRT